MRAYSHSTTPKEYRDRRETPWPVFEAITAHLGIRPEVDVAAGEQNTKCPEYIDWSMNALQARWPAKVCWMNPPYSRPAVWCRKAAIESRGGATVIGLLPDDRSTAWYRHVVHPTASAIFVTDRRIAFLDSEGNPQTGNPKGSLVVIWTPWRVESPAFGFISIPGGDEHGG